MRTYFARILDDEQLQELLYKIELEFGARPHHEGELTFVYAPDGDKVVISTPIGNGMNAVRLHREVFTNV